MTRWAVGVAEAAGNAGALERRIMEGIGSAPGAWNGFAVLFRVPGARTASECMPVLMVGLLWDPLPDTLRSPGRGRFGRLRELAAAMTARADLLSVEEQVDRRVRRRAVQALVRGAYLAAVAEQDSEHRAPSALLRRGVPIWLGCWIGTMLIWGIGGRSRLLISIVTWPGACMSRPAVPGRTRSGVRWRLLAGVSGVSGRCRRLSSRS